MDGGYIPNQVSPLLFTENMAEALEEKVVRLPKDYYVILRFWCYCNIQQCWNFSNTSDKREHEFGEFILEGFYCYFLLWNCTKDWNFGPQFPVEFWKCRPKLKNHGKWHENDINSSWYTWKSNGNSDATSTAEVFGPFLFARKRRSLIDATTFFICFWNFLCLKELRRQTDNDFPLD